jgi:diaminohydroxyphosphoribosylaminopyrimidine deaminase/5-amino-6-(5-phosphoribosylamino)uracil reductase
VHDDRAASDAIIVGTGTVLADDPSLTARDEAGELLAHQPLPVVIGDREVPQDAAVRRHPNPPLFLPGHDLAAALVDLRDRGVRTAYVEAGPVLSDALLRAGLVDELHVYLAPTLLGGPRTATTDLGVGTIAQQRRLRLQRVERVDDDVLLVALDPTARHLNPWPPDSTVAGTTPAGTTPADSTQTSQTIQQGA